MNKQINLIINGKGGVGKSFFATNFVQYLKDCGIAHCAIDSDHENSTLKRSTHNRSSSILSTTIDSNGRTIWIADAHRGDGKRFVVHADELLTAFVELESAIRGR